MEEQRVNSAQETVIPENTGPVFKLTKRLAIWLNFDASDVKDERKARKWLAEQICWLIIKIVFGYFMVQSSITIVSDFAQETTSSAVYTMYNTSMALPKSTICLPLVPSELDDYQTQISNETISEHLTATFTKGAHYQEALRIHFDNINNKAEALDSEKIWANPIIFLAYNYLALMESFQNLACMKSEQLKLFRDDNIQNNSENLALALNYLDERLDALKITRADLREKIGNDISFLYTLNITHSTNSTETRIKPQRVSHVGFDKICYQVDFDSHLFRSVEDTITIKATHASLSYPRSQATTQTLQILVGFNAKEQLDVNLVDNNQVFSTKVNEHHFLPIRIIADYKALPVVNGKIRCSDLTPVDRCKADCRSEQIQKWCKCTPLTTTQTLSTTECSFAHYAECDITTAFKYQNMEEMQRCFDNCFESCQRRNIDLSHSARTFYASNQAVVTLVMASFDYPVFEETSAWTYSSFMGAFGGVVGLWLGINILDIVHLITNFLFLRSNGSSSKDSEREVTTNDTQKQQRSVFTTGRRTKALLVFWGINADKTKNKTTAAKFIAGKTIWTISAVVLAVVTIVLSVNTIADYLDQSKVSDLRIIYNKNLSFPNSTICLPLFFGELYVENSISNSSLNQDLTTYLNSITAKEELLADRNTTNWPYILLHVAHAYFISMTEFETTLQENGEASKDSDLLSAMITFEMKMAALNASISEIQKNWGDIVAYKCNIGMGQDYSLSFIDFTRVTFVNAAKICYEMPLQNIPLTTRLHTELTIQTDFIRISISYDELPNPFEFGAYRGNVTLDLLNRRHIDDELIADSFIVHDFTCERHFLTEINLVHSTLPADKTLCSKEFTLDECQAQCQIKSIKKLCNCMPIFWAANQRTQQENDICTLERYLSCLESDSSKRNDFQNCVGQCAQKCEKWYFKFTQKCEHERSSWKDDFFIAFKDTNYPLIEERMKWTFETLLGELGGIVGFLLGYSFYFMIQYLLFIIIRFGAHILSKAKKIIATESTSVIELRPQPQANRLSDLFKLNQNGTKATSVFLKLYRLFEVDRLWSAGDNILSVKKVLLTTMMISIFTLFSYLTVVMGISFIQEYREENTISVMKLQFNKSISLPISTVCMDIWPTDMETGVLVWDWYYDYDPIVADMDSRALANFSVHRLEAFFCQTNFTKYSFLQEKRWTNITVFFVYYYFAELNIWERGFLMNADDVIRDMNFLGLTEGLHFIEKQMQSLNISIDELRQAFGRQFARINSLSALQISSATDYNGCPVTNRTEILIHLVSSIGKYQICYQDSARFDLFPFYDPQQSILITARTPYYRYTKNSDRYIHIDFSNGNMTGIEVNGPLNDYDTNTVNIVTNFATKSLSVVSVDAEYMTLSNEIAKCSENSTFEYCVAKCQVDFIRTNCNCTPTAWSTYSEYTTPTQTFPICKLSGLGDCRAYSRYAADDAISNCKKTCPSLCRRSSFRTFTTEEETTVERNISIEIKVAAYDYVVFEEQLVWTFDRITAAIGGVIGFYLGWDIMIITEFFVNIVSKVAQALFRLVLSKNDQ